MFLYLCTLKRGVGGIVLFEFFYLEHNLRVFDKPIKTFCIQTLSSEANKMKEFFLMEVLLYR